jgi:sec-independent protein translocase protein TatB
MFDIGGGELLLIGIVALIAIGPKELPTVLRTLGQWMGKLRRMASEFQNQFQEAMREAEMADLKKQVDEMTSQAQSYANFDPVGEVRREFESAQQQIESAVAEKPTAETPSPITASAGGAPTIAPSASAEPAVATRTDADAAAPATRSAEPPAGNSGPCTQDAGGKPA